MGCWGDCLALTEADSEAGAGSVLPTLISQRLNQDEQ